MLELKLGKIEVYNEETNTFDVECNGPVFELEHSLLSMSKWEAKYKKPFMSNKDDKTSDELLDYIRMMVVRGDANHLIESLTNTDLQDIIKYISEDKQTATWFSEDKAQKKTTSEVITSEVIYYMMFSNQIPKECETWNINRLLTLIRVFSEKAKEHDPNRKKMTREQLAAKHRALNEANKRRFKTKG